MRILHRLGSVLTVDEAARRLRVDPADVRQEIMTGRLAAVNVAGKTRIMRSALRAFCGLDQRRRSPWGRLGMPAVALAIVIASVAIASEFPFPLWDGEEISPQAVLFKDSAVVSEGNPDRYAPINAPLDYRRFNHAPNPDGRGFTHSLMSLQHQNNLEPGSYSFPWTLFLQLDTNHDHGDGVGSHLRLHNRGAGWASAYHADAFARGTGTTLGNNIEMLDVAGQGAFTVGMNIQNKAFTANAGLQIQVGPLPDTHPLWQPGMDGGWQRGIRLSGGRFGTGIELGPGTFGNRGLWLRGDYAKGIDLGPNSLNMQAGSLLELADDQDIGMRYNAGRQRIEFLEGEAVIAFIDVHHRERDLSN